MKSLTVEELTNNVLKECLKRNYEFKGFAGDIKGCDTKLNLYCIKHEHNWSTTNYDSFVGKRKSGCPICGGSLKISESQMIENVKKECGKRGYEFLGFVGKFKGNRTKLVLRCIKHEYTWSTTNYYSFIGKQKCGCSICSGCLKLTEEKIIENVKNKCEILNYEFLGLCKFNGNETRLKLRCKKDEYSWEVSYHKLMQNRKCPMCSNHVKISEQQMIENVKKECIVRKYKFLGLVEYKGTNDTYLILECLTCGKKWRSTTYSKFMQNRGCIQCAKNKQIEVITRNKLSKQQIIDNVKNKCKNTNIKFLGLVEHKSVNNTYLILECLTCGKIWQSTTYAKFISTKFKHKCDNAVKPTQLEADEKVNSICIRKNYSLLEPFVYVNYNTKIKLKCNKDEHEWITSYNSLVKNDSNCPKCNIDIQIKKYRKSQYAAETNVNKKCLERNYKCDNFEYIGNNNTYLSLTCDKGHKWNTTNYYSFMSGVGCPICKSSKLELKITDLLNENNIQFLCQHSFEKLKSKRWKQTLDFYLPDYNIAIECQGEQHFKCVEFFGGKSEYVKNIKRDERKYNICKEQGIRILYYTECSADIIPDVYYDKIFTNVSDLLNEIELN